MTIKVPFYVFLLQIVVMETQGGLSRHNQSKLVETIMMPPKEEEFPNELTTETQVDRQRVSDILTGPEGNQYIFRQRNYYHSHVLSAWIVFFIVIGVIIFWIFCFCCVLFSPCSVLFCLPYDEIVVGDSCFSC